MLEKTSTGFNVKIICPECNVQNAISSSVSETTGLSSFTVHNFKRHFNKHQPSTSTGGEGDEQVIHKTGDVKNNATECNELKQQINNNNATIEKLKKRVNTLKESLASKDCADCSVYEVMLKQKDDSLSEYAQKMERQANLPCNRCDELEKQIDCRESSFPEYQQHSEEESLRRISDLESKLKEQGKFIF